MSQSRSQRRMLVAHDTAPPPHPNCNCHVLPMLHGVGICFVVKMQLHRLYNLPVCSCHDATRSRGWAPRPLHVCVRHPIFPDSSYLQLPHIPGPALIPLQFTCRRSLSGPCMHISHTHTERAKRAQHMAREEARNETEISVYRMHR